MVLQLIVKTPNCKIPVQTVECDPLWNVEGLKKHLANSFPIKSKDVRIIFSGKLLQDNRILKNIFTGNEENHTIHLVCPFDSPEKLVQAPGTYVKTEREADAKDTNASRNTVAEMSPEELKKKYSEYYNYVYQTYYNHLLQSYSGAQINHRFTSPSDQGITNLPQPNLQPPQMANNPDRQGFVQMAAAGGGAGDEFEEGFNRDWIYYIFKFVMFSIIVYYSSALNALMLIGIFGVIYLLQEGWFRFDRNRRDAPIIRGNVNPVASDNDTTPNTSSESTNAENLIGINTQEANVQQPSIFQKFVLILKLIGTFILTFFMSLIPEQPAPLNLN